MGASTQGDSMSEATTTMPAPSQREEVLTALRNLKMASLLQVIATIITGVSLAYILAAAANIALMLVTGIGVLAGALIGLVITIVAVYAFLLPSAKQFARWRPAEFSTASNLMRVGYIWGAIILIIAIAIIIAGVVSINIIAALGGLGIAVIGGILFLVGYVGNIVYFIKLKDVFNSAMFLAAAIILIVGIFVPIAFIAWILAFVETRSVEGKVSSGLIQV